MLSPPQAGGAAVWLPYGSHVGKDDLAQIRVDCGQAVSDSRILRKTGEG
jgi:hypothetical protein